MEHETVVCKECGEYVINCIHCKKFIDGNFICDDDLHYCSLTCLFKKNELAALERKEKRKKMLAGELTNES